jgi:hypothetical protein
MLARFFKKSEPISFLSLLLLLLVYTAIHVFVDLQVIINLKSIFSFLGIFLLLSSFLFFTEFIIRKNSLTPLNYYALFVFVLLVGLFPDMINYSRISLSNLFIFLASRRIYSIKTKKEHLLKLFDSGLYIGVSFLLYPVSILFFLLIYIAYAIYIKIVSKDLLLPIVGFLTPIFIVFAYFFFKEDMASFINLIEINIGFDYHKYQNSHFYMPAIFVVFFLFWGILKIFSRRHAMGKETKNTLNLVLVHLLITLIIINIHNLEIDKNSQFIFFPIAVFLGNLFSNIKSYRIKDVLLYSFIVFSFVLLFI